MFRVTGALVAFFAGVITGFSWAIAQPPVRHVDPKFIVVDGEFVMLDRGGHWWKAQKETTVPCHAADCPVCD